MAVSAARPMDAVPLLAQTEWVQAVRAVYGQHAIQVIDLVLQELCSITFDFRLRPFPSQVLVLDPDPVGAGNADPEIREREAIVPDLEILVTDVQDLRIDQGERLVHLHVHHTNGGSDLRRGDGPAVTEAGLPIT